MLELHSRTIPHIKLKKSGKHRPSPSDKIPKAHALGTLTEWGHQPPYLFPHLASITLLQRCSLLVPYLHSHFPNKVWLNLLKFLIPNPPCWTGLQIWFQLTGWNLCSSPIPLHKKYFWSFPILLATYTRIGKRERNQVGRLESVLLIKETLPPWISKVASTLLTFVPSSH